ncbi:type II toxin-antitoxin system RelE/ParE family toxin [Gordonia alkaliphila]|uniref:type II toxin-antitoxin system RelE/ParE family toxin n=1 Tax=Gordonia alkaliphila TaxID=1053547 RepID=UPI001FF2C49C|nr:type II toxin-antitoxin system RelE/ParE family toxin [Gordonia alkaliphila]MCK0441150.1 type II toxin-antitoxin system RelE/ParE family toxin [Gordonia alkaliphila]
MTSQIRMWHDVAEFIDDLPDKQYRSVKAALIMLEEEGPLLRRPLCDLVIGGKFSNLKELRPPGTTIRILFIFDPDSTAVLLVAGDKRGQWTKWYPKAMREAERRYDEWLQAR